MDMMPEIPKDLQDDVERQLDQGERIRWMEQPVPRFFTAGSTSAFIFGIPWTAFAVFWICGASGFKRPDFSKGGSSFFPLFGVPFVLIGIAMLLSPLWARRKGLKTVYVITDRRAITFDGGWTTTIRNYTPEQLKNMYRKEKKDGSGDVVLGQVVGMVTKGGQAQMMDVGFLRVRDVRKTEQMLRELMGQSAPAAQ
ncbi:MAG: hypothetical protein ABSA67_00655 [Candidatus Brocadiia bacterium]|jgi:hypothetical protein